MLFGTIGGMRGRRIEVKKRRTCRVTKEIKGSSKGRKVCKNISSHDTLRSETED
jgi:hypothetical protein